MTNQPYLYDPTRNVLRQRAEMHEPHPMYENRVIQYKKHLASLPAYTPVSGWVPEVGKEYRINVDFYVKHLAPDTHFESVAVPIEQKQEEPDLGKATEELIATILKDHTTYVPQTGGYLIHGAIKELTNLVKSSFAAGVESGKKNSFSLEDMIECWEAAWKIATDGWVWPSKHQTEQYFKTKFNINIDEESNPGINIPTP